MSDLGASASVDLCSVIKCHGKMPTKSSFSKNA